MAVVALVGDAGRCLSCKDHFPVPKEAVYHPVHYNQNGFEVVAIADAFDLGRYEFNVLKYLLRAQLKGNQLEDLKKARWYLDRRIGELEK